MSVVERFLGNLVDKFKTRNIKLYLGVVIFLIAVQAGLATEYADELIGEDLTDVLEWINLALIALTGASTKKDENADTDDE